MALTRLRLGHSFLTYSFLLNRQPLPTCQHCQSPLTIVHILVICPHYIDIRFRLEIPFSFSEILSKSHHITSLFIFLRQSDVFQKIQSFSKRCASSLNCSVCHNKRKIKSFFSVHFFAKKSTYLIFTIPTHLRKTKT